MIALDATSAGPTTVITANVHGDEVTGLVAVQHLDRLLQRSLVRGRVLLYPSLNPGGLEARKRVLPDDGADLNRLFPGDPDGSTSEQLAAELWDELRRRAPDTVIDLHADSAISIPYAIVDRAVRLEGAVQRRMSERLLALGQASGLTLLREYPDEEYLRFGLDHSLAGAMVNHAGVPSITIEAGPRRAVDPGAVQIAVDCVVRMLFHLGHVEEAPAAHASRMDGGVWRRASAPRTRRAGVFVPGIAPGGRFEKGALLGIVYGVDGETLDEVRAIAAGIVVSWTEVGWTEARGVPGTLGLEELPSPRVGVADSASARSDR